MSNAAVLIRGLLVIRQAALLNAAESVGLARAFYLCAADDASARARVFAARLIAPGV